MSWVRCLKQPIIMVNLQRAMQINRYYIENERRKVFMFKFEAPEMEVITFEVEDVITTSGTGDIITPDDEF